MANKGMSVSNSQKRLNTLTTSESNFKEVTRKRKASKPKPPLAPAEPSEFQLQLLQIKQKEKMVLLAQQTSEVLMKARPLGSETSLLPNSARDLISIDASRTNQDATSRTIQYFVEDRQMVAPLNINLSEETERKSSALPA